jgi:hypothetical protein
MHLKHLIASPDRGMSLSSILFLLTLLSAGSLNADMRIINNSDNIIDESNQKYQENLEVFDVAIMEEAFLGYLLLCCSEDIFVIQ